MCVCLSLSLTGAGSPRVDVQMCWSPEEMMSNTVKNTENSLSGWTRWKSHKESFDCISIETEDCEHHKKIMSNIKQTLCTNILLQDIHTDNEVMVYLSTDRELFQCHQPNVNLYHLKDREEKIWLTEGIGRTMPVAKVSVLWTVPARRYHTKERKKIKKQGKGKRKKKQNKSTFSLVGG